jgi:hypothetical protein
MKFTKAEVEYTDDHGDNREQCAECAHYINPTTCAIVAGRIRPEGWCARFEARAHKADSGRLEYQRPVYGGSLHDAFRLPHSAIRALGNGDPEAGQAVANDMSATTWRSATASFIRMSFVTLARATSRPAAACCKNLSPRSGIEGEP